MELRFRYTLLDGRLREGICVRTENGRILSVQESAGAFEEGILAPGLIDLHIHGLLGADTMQGRDAVRRMAEALPRFGVTSFLPTTMNAAEAEIRGALSGIEEAMHSAAGARILGAHLEGPFLAKTHLGAQDPAFCIPVTPENLQRICKGHEKTLRLLSLSPELPGAPEMIRSLAGMGIAVSAAHTGASFEEMQHAADCGLSQVTHLFNGMNALNHRAPGVPGAGLLIDSLSCQLIADGIHLHPEMLKLCLRVKGADGLCLITDAMAACGMPDGEYMLGNVQVYVRDGVARIAQGNLAGSTLTLDQAVRNMMRFAGATPEQALCMASRTPARLLGLADMGRIASGMRADLVVLREDFTVRKTFVDGKVRFSGDGI